MLLLFDWIRGLWSNVMYVLTEDFILPLGRFGEVPFIFILLSYGLINIVVIRIINSRG